MPSYLFLCSHRTQDECFQKRLFGSNRHWDIIKAIRKDDTIFLYNVNSRILFGRFIATGKVGWDIDPNAWSYMPIRFHAQAEVEWKEDALRMFEDAPRRFPFLVDKNLCRLTSEQEEAISKALEGAEAARLVSVISEGPLQSIESDAERMFADFLDIHDIGYIRFSQTPADFSRVLKEMRAKRPDFLVFADQNYFIEVKPNPTRYKSPEVRVEHEELEKLKQLELATGIKVLLAFPIDLHGTEWRAFQPAWAWAKGTIRTESGKDFVTINVKELDRFRLPFI